MSDTEPPKETATKSRPGMWANVVFHAASRHPLVFLGVILLALMPVGFWYFSPQPKNSAVVVFHIAPKPQLLHDLPVAITGDYATYKALQMSLVKNRQTLDAVLNNPEIGNLAMVRNAHPDGTAWLERDLWVEADSRNGEFMRVTIDGENDQELLALLNGLAKVYPTTAHERENGTRLRRQEELEKTLIKAKQELKLYQTKIDEIAVTLGSKDGPTLAALDVVRRDSFRMAVREHASLREELTLIAGYLFYMKSPAILAVAGAFWVPTLPSQAAPPAIESERAALLQAQYDKIKAKVDQASLKVVGQQKEIGKSNVYRIDLENINLEFTQKEKVALRIADEIERLKIEGKLSSNVTVAEGPYIVSGNERSHRLKYALLASLGVFLVGFAGLVGCEYRCQRVTALKPASGPPLA
jgi:hypothetical protein